MKYLTNMSWILLEEADFLPHYFLAKISSSVPPNAKGGTLIPDEVPTTRVSSQILFFCQIFQWSDSHHVCSYSIHSCAQWHQLKLSHTSRHGHADHKNFSPSLPEIIQVLIFKLCTYLRPQLNHPTSIWCSIHHSPAGFSTGISRLCSTLLVSSCKFAPAVAPFASTTTHNSSFISKCISIPQPENDKLSVLLMSVFIHCNIKSAFIFKLPIMLFNSSESLLPIKSQCYYCSVLKSLSFWNFRYVNKTNCNVCL